jgi:hypothetical protein
MPLTQWLRTEPMEDRLLVCEHVGGIHFEQMDA